MDAEQSLIYFDNAATSFPNPPEIARAVSRSLHREAVNPGRSGYDLALAAGARIDALRRAVVRFFGADDLDPNRAVFCANATDALNLALRGILRRGDHVVATVLEHNSVLRPLHMLRREVGIEFDLAGCDRYGFVDPAAVAALIRPETRLVVLNHASNVHGAVQPAAEIGGICRRHGVLFLLDTAQTAGVLPIEMTAWGVDLLAYTGHKSLLGPTGTGGLLVGEDVEIRGTRWGGTGVRSAQLEHPAEFPYRLEAGTPNTAGLAGLAAGLEWLSRPKAGSILAHETALARRFLDGCRTIDRVRLFGPAAEPSVAAERRLPVVSINVDGMPPETVGQFLDADGNIAVRTGLQCAPLAHEALGTAPDGTVRFSFGPFNTAVQIDRALEALTDICAG